MANEFMRRASERGYDKFTEIAQNFWDLINAIRTLPEDVIVYVMAHIERDGSGNEKIKTIGRMLDEKITIEGMFTIVLKTAVSDGVYNFSTQNNGNDTVKSPLGLFKSSLIDNDLKAVDTAIREYYELTPAATEEKKQVAEEVAQQSLEELASKDEPAPVEEAAPVRKTRKVREPQPAEEVATPPVQPTSEATTEQPVRRRRRRVVENEDDDLPF
jgi:hypothetical protein